MHPRSAGRLADTEVAVKADGTLLGFLHNLYTARRTGATTTGSAVRGYLSATFAT